DLIAARQRARIARRLSPMEVLTQIRSGGPRAKGGCSSPLPHGRLGSAPPLSIEEKNLVKRILTTLALAATFCTATAGTALAKKYPPHPHDPHVAFTGANVNMGMVIFGALLIV